MKLCKMCKKKSGFLQTVIFHKTWKSFLKVKVESKKIFESKLWKKSKKKVQIYWEFTISQFHNLKVKNIFESKSKKIFESKLCKKKWNINPYLLGIHNFTKL